MPMRVLVVDDERDICDLMAIWLEDDPRCAAVLQAHDLDRAQCIAETEHPDAILLDFQVGANTSVDALPDLRRSCPDARIIIHTGSRDDALRAEVLHLGADRVVEKATMSLPDVVETVLGDGTSHQSDAEQEVYEPAQRAFP
jgi:DNA-binding response OmpR family regulator